MSDSRDRFLELMKKEILKLDLAELDFGIYRILNYRRAEIEAFFDSELPNLLDEAMGREGESRRTELAARLDQLKASLDDAAAGFGYHSAFIGEDLRPELRMSPKAREYSEVEAALAALQDGEVFTGSEEDRLYNALYTFFSRYYRDGDFQPQQRRARDARYSVPYNGEDVHFHWRSKGSHYVKTTEELRSYTFRSGEWRVRFELVDAFQEPDNVKGNSRYFFPVPEECRTEGEGEERFFVVPFAFRRLTAAEEKRYQKKQDDLKGDNVQERIINDLGPNIDPPSGVSKEDLTYHLRRYSRKNRADYFVHPQLGEFLRGELDYYLKNEFLDMEGLTTTEAMADRLLKMRVLREVAGRIIDVLDEIETFQARLFEKRRFVLDSHYLVPIHLVPRDLWDVVLANKGQIQQWEDDFGLSGRVGRGTLESHPTLIVDTSFFLPGFTGKLLESIDDLDGCLDGFLVNGENFGALRTLLPSVRSRAQMVYIDPPYNTGNDGFLYKDEFSRHSAWLSLMAPRLQLGRELLAVSGLLFCSIDDNELQNLSALVKSAYGEGNFLANLVWKSKSGGASDSAHFAVDHEYVVGAARDSRRAALGLDTEAAVTTSYSYSDESGEYSLERLDKQNLGYLESLDFEISDPDGNIYRPHQKDPTRPNARWRWSESTVAARYDELVFKDGNVYTKNYRKLGAVARSLLVDDRFGRTRTGKTDLYALFGFDAFSNPKPVKLLSHLIRVGAPEGGLVVDFFAGSGTTGQAAIELTRATGNRYPFMLVDMGEYVDQVLKRRIAKVMYAPEWKDGAPKAEPEVKSESPEEWVSLSPRLIQVLKLEAYEDSLNSLGIAGNHGGKQQIRYAIPSSVDRSPCLLVTEKLEEPFEYQLEVHSEEGVRLVDVDLVTTFNLMKGIRPKRYRELDHEGRRYVIIEGSDGGEAVLVVWRGVRDLDPAAERAFLEEQIPNVLGAGLADYVRIWHNADSALPNGVSLDAEFKRLMFEPEPALL